MIPRTLPPVHSPLPLRALASGALAALAPGPFDARVESLVRGGYGPAGLLFTDSGTSALRLALEGLNAVGRPGPVALPAYSCYDVATAAVGAGVDVLLYDLDPETLSPDPDSLRRTLELGAVGVVVVHLYGVPVEMERAGRIVRDGDAVLIEDAAQGAGGRYFGRPLGSLGSLGVLSFGRGKGITGGRGGLLLANDEVGQEVVRAVERRAGHRRAGIAPLAASAAQWLLGRPGLYGLPLAVPWLGLGETRYRPPEPPGSLPRAASGVLAITLRLADPAARVRRAHAARLLARLEETERLRPVRPPDSGTPGWLRLPVVAGDGRVAGGVIPAGRRLGVMPGYPATLDRLPPLRGAIGVSTAPHPGAERLAGGLLTLPTHGRLRESDLERLEAWLAAL